MLEDHQRAALMPNPANLSWAHFVRSRFVSKSRDSVFAVEIVQVVPQSQLHAEISGIVERGAGDSLPVTFDFVGILDFESREMKIHDGQGTASARSYAGRFSENGRVLTLHSTAGQRPSKSMHLVHEETIQELFGG